MSEILTLDALVALIKEVQPSLDDTAIAADQSVIDELGLDSLDMLQLSRRISRDYDLDLDLDAWAEKAGQHHGSVGSILDFLGAESTV
jgi:acyl carrier protein